MSRRRPAADPRAGGAPPPGTPLAGAWRHAPRWVKLLYLALLAWVLAALPLLLTLGSLIEWELSRAWQRRVHELSAAITVFAVAGYLVSREARCHLARQPLWPTRLQTLLFALPLLAGLLHLCVWLTTERAVVLAAVAAGTHRTEPGVVLGIADGHPDEPSCRREATIVWRDAGEEDNCLSMQGAEALAAGMAVRRSVWAGPVGRIRSTAIEPSAGSSWRSALAHAHLASRPVVLMLGIPVSVFFCAFTMVSKRGFIWLGIIVGAWLLYWAPIL